MVRAENASLMTLDGTRTYIVGWRHAVVIDPGPDEAAHLDSVARELRESEVVDIVVTHRHDDHAGGVDGLVTRLSGRPGLIVRQRRANPGGGLRDGVSIETDSGRLTAMATPGHTPDHLAFVWGVEPSGGGEGSSEGAADRGAGSDPGTAVPGQMGRLGGQPDGATSPSPQVAVFVGDLLLGKGETALVAAPEGNVADYLRSLQKVEAVRAARLFPAHGPIIANPDEAIGRFRDHRLRRVEQVRALLLAEPASTTSVLVDRMYGQGLPERIRAAAEASVEAVRLYLASGDA